jgi:hypothetical protein
MIVLKEKGGCSAALPSYPVSLRRWRYPTVES